MKFAVPGVASAIVGAVVGAAAVFGVTAALQQNVRPDIDHGDAKSSLLGNVQYGSR